MRRSRLLRGIATLSIHVLTLIALTGSTSALAATLSVTSRSDAGPGSLRQAIADATTIIQKNQATTSDDDVAP